jgi:type VII secretion effector (TIGR04197 family)
MARIRVNTEDVKNKARDFDSAAEAFTRAGDDILAAAMAMPSYDGQLSGPARKMGYEFQQQARELSTALAGDAESLRKTAQAFEEVDNQTTTAFGESLLSISTSPLYPKGGKPRGLASIMPKEDEGGGDDTDVGPHTITVTNPDGSVTTITYDRVLMTDGSVVEYRNERTVYPDGSIIEKGYQKTTRPDGVIVEKTTLKVENDFKTQEDIDNWYKQLAADEELADCWPPYQLATALWKQFRYRILNDYSDPSPSFGVGDRIVSTSEVEVITFPTGATQTKTTIIIQTVATDGTIKKENKWDLFM